MLKEKESLEKENNSLRNELSSSNEKIIDLEKLTFVKEENLFLKEKISSLTKDPKKFVKGKENLGLILGAQKYSLDKGGLFF